MVKIWFRDIEIKSVSNSSGIFSGSSIQWKYRHAGKDNQAFGKVSGKHCMISRISLSLDDRDQIDSYTMGRSSTT